MSFSFRTAAVVNAWRPRVVITKITDGDTFRANLDFGWRHWDLDPGVGGEGSFRILNINAPERKGATLAAGNASRDYLATLLPLGATFPLLSYEVRWADDFGRTLADVELPDGRLVSEAMISAGQAVPYTHARSA